MSKEENGKEEKKVFIGKRKENQEQDQNEKGKKGSKLEHHGRRLNRLEICKRKGASACYGNNLSSCEEKPQSSK